MRLEAFRVQNYKKVDDTGWVTARDLTVLVGKNEAGKSAIFRGLSKLNPSDGEKYDGLKEFPRRRYTDEFTTQDWPVASARFLLDDGERQSLTQLCPLLRETKTATVTRRYSWQTAVDFDPAPAREPVGADDLRASIDSASRTVEELTVPEGKGDALAPIKQNVSNALQQARGGVPVQGDLTKAHIDAAVKAIATYANEAWLKELLDPVAAPLRRLCERAENEENLRQAQKWVTEHLSRFIYFDKYDVIDSAIHIPNFVSKLSSTPNAPRVRATHCLFKHVGLDLKKLASLGRHQSVQGEDSGIRREVDERAILSSSASSAITKKFGDWWEQRKHEFRYQLDGDYFRVWVRDDLDPSEIELDQRSAGMQYFFSFFVIFLVEAEEAHANSILLLDEPGLHLHGTAQAKVVEFLRKLSKDNQTLYSTHSPFMVDANHLEDARAVYEDKHGTTKVTEDVWPRDRDSLFPLQAALGYQLAQGLFVAKRQVIVEGITDYWLLKAVDHALAALKRDHLRTDVILVPSAGITKLLPLASMLMGHDVEVAALLDGDEPARREGKKLAERLLAGDDRKCIFIGDLVSETSAEIEDLFPEDDYLKVVREAYPGIDSSFTAAEKSILGITNRLQALFNRKALGKFEKWKVAAVLRDRILAAPEKTPGPTLDVIESVFQKLNGVFTSPSK